MTHVAVIGGEGRMGSRHCRTLERLNYSYQSFDILNGQYDIDYNKFSHFIVTTPSVTHAAIYRVLRQQTDKPILIEKPVITDMKDIDILDDVKVFHGTIRRFDDIYKDIAEWNKVYGINSIHMVKRGLTPKNVDSYGGVYLDLLIHNLDMILHLLPDATFRKFDDLIWLQGNYRGILAVSYTDNHDEITDTITFENMDSGHKLFVNFGQHTVHYDNGKVSTYSRYQPLESELYHFLNGGTNNSKQAHEICMTIETC